MKQYMVVERFKSSCSDSAYERVHMKGRMLPDALNYVNSWPNRDNNMCDQLMETNSLALFGQWFSHWSDLADFELLSIA